MKKLGILTLFMLVSAVVLASSPQYSLGPDSQRQPNSPRGKITHYTWTSKIFPGTVRDYWVYVPAQYTPAKPACVMVFQDGAGFVKEDGESRVPVVFDNLIHKHEIPVTIGIFINPGVLPSLSGDQPARYNRSFEYDGLGGRYAKFLLNEILPEVGKHYNLSNNPNDRAIAGVSSGGICAFTVAWNHPEAFRRVLSFVGSFTGLRGGDIYPTLIRKTEPKPLRVFLQDGTKDLNIYAGSWYLNAQAMASALEYAGYDVKVVIGNEDHNMKQGGAILPDALRWLWRDYPKPLTTPQGAGDRQFSTLILGPSRNWETISQGHESAAELAVDKRGSVFFADGARSRIFKIDGGGTITPFLQNTHGARGLSFGPDGRLYACQPGRNRIVAYSPTREESLIAKGISCHDLAITHSGAIYFADPSNRQIGYLSARRKKRVVYEGIAHPGRVRLSPDQSLLVADDPDGKWIMSFQIEPDGSLGNGEPFYRLETLDESSAPGADGMTLDTEGYLYVATRLGLQVCDQPGRVVAIINGPSAAAISDVALGGPNLRMLYVTSGGTVFRRRIQRQGVPTGTLVKPPVPQL